MVLRCLDVPEVVQAEGTTFLPRIGCVRVMPLGIADRPAYCAFAAGLAREDLRLRFAGAVKLDSPQLRAQLLAIDHDRVEVLAAFDRDGAILGVARLVRDGAAAELALVVRSDLKRRGLGRLLLECTVLEARRRGVTMLIGQVLTENHPMLRLAMRVGFRPVAMSGFFTELRRELVPLTPKEENDEG